MHYNLTCRAATWVVHSGLMFLALSYAVSSPSYGQQAIGNQTVPNDTSSPSQNLRTIPSRAPATSILPEPSPTEDRLLTERLSDYLQNNHLPLVRAQVSEQPSGERKVILHGYVASEYGHGDAVQKTRNFLGDPKIEVENRIVVQPELLEPSSQSSVSKFSTQNPAVASNSIGDKIDAISGIERLNRSEVRSQALPSAAIGCWEGQEIVDSCRVVSGPNVAAFTPATFRLCYQMSDPEHFELTLANSNLNPDQIIWTSLLNRLFQHTTMDNIDTRVEIAAGSQQGDVRLLSFYHFDEHDRVFGIFSQNSSHEGAQALDCHVWPKSLHCLIETKKSLNEFNPWTECNSHADLTKALH
jgi:hypothetical protein